MQIYDTPEGESITGELEFLSQLSIFLVNFQHIMQYSHGQIRQLFDRIAHRYDLLNRLLSLGIDQRWRAHMISSCGSIEHPRILDLATGTGDVLRAAGRLAPAMMVGLDLSRPMLDRARRKLRDRPCALVEGVAESLPFKSASFDLVLVAFGVRNFSVRKDGLAEMRRILRSGGEVRILDFSRPDGSFQTVYLPYFRRILPRIGGLISGNTDAYTYLPDTVMEFPSPDEFGVELKAAGFSGITWTPLSHGITTLYAATAGHHSHRNT